MSSFDRYYATIELQIKRFIHSASGEYSVAPCWLVLPPSKPAFVKTIAIPDSLYCLTHGLKDAHSLTLKHIDIVDNLNKRCEISKNYAGLVWSFASKQAIKKDNIFPSFNIIPTLHNCYYQITCH